MKKILRKQMRSCYMQHNGKPLSDTRLESGVPAGPDTNSNWGSGWRTSRIREFILCMPILTLLSILAILIGLVITGCALMLVLHLAHLLWIPPA